ncbi:DNA replication licensing factor MCM3 [Platysternon megacephalum]|uniref:DNA replication licensing factor MCM3 n=1 Tax=Platysternon megacephalum TaxID=55544 RepID=A0A4D9EMD8_9SAUR|nr:DNA replication licensing factor MCM3 [Platysternon megacephalum]
MAQQWPFGEAPVHVHPFLWLGPGLAPVPFQGLSTGETGVVCLIFLVFSVDTIFLVSVYVLSVPGVGKGRSRECRYFIWGIESQCLVMSFLTCPCLSGFLPLHPEGVTQHTGMVPMLLPWAGGPPSLGCGGFEAGAVVSSFSESELLLCASLCMEGAASLCRKEAPIQTPSKRCCPGAVSLPNPLYLWLVAARAEALLSAPA